MIRAKRVMSWRWRVGRGRGARRVLALPLTTGNLPIGAVYLYRCTPTPFTAVHKDRAAAYARILALDEHPT